MRLFLFFALVMGPIAAQAGFVEVGASANYRSSGYNKDNYVEAISYTASISYYFWEMSAVEVNYTTGYSKQVTKGSGETDPKETVEDNLQLTSMDLILSFAKRTDTFRPYIKVGGGYLDKQRFRRVNDDNTEMISHQYGIVPSGGFGLSISVTKELSFKLGLDAWTSPLDSDDPLIIDYVGRAGISWMF
jgi:outer membrane protein W